MAIVRALEASGETLEAFSARQTVSLSTGVQVAPALSRVGWGGPRGPQRAQPEGRYSPKARRAAVEAFTRATALIRPLQGDQLPVPAQQRVGSDDRGDAFQRLPVQDLGARSLARGQEGWASRP